MDSALVPCPACDRHVRATEAACPFCAAPLPDDLARRAVPPAPRRLGRAAALAFGASLTLAACTNEVVTGAAQGGTSGASGTGGAGGSTVSGGTGGSSGGGGDVGVPLYGGPSPPYDAGAPPPPPGDGGDGDAAPPTDDGGDAAPPHDGGHEGGIAPAYGLPP
jgi:hypothetical protein